MVHEAVSLNALSDQTRQRDALLVPVQQRPSALRKRLSAAAVDRVVGIAAKLAYKHPGADPALYGVRVIRNVPYGDGAIAEQTLDVYLPDTEPVGLMPVALYVHGGAFRLLSKESHWMMAVAFARRGYVVFNINYRLAPAHKFPAALLDVNRAWLWALDHARQYGGDPERIVVAGESAGANLVTALALEASYKRPEPFAKEVFGRGRRPAAVMAACGILEVSNIERFFSRRRMSSVLTDWLTDMRDAYLGGPYSHAPRSLELADPVTILERGDQPERPLPPFFLPIGGADPLVDDHKRMSAALKVLGVPNEMRVYPGEVHAFHMMTWRPAAQRLWRDTFRYLRDAVPESAESPVRVKPLPSRGGSWLRDRIITAMAA